jgi:hypothetical protein
MIRKAGNLILLGSLLLLLPLSGHAQKKTGEVEVGLGVAYGFEIATDGELGINGSVYYSVTDRIRLGADAIYYLLNDPQFQKPLFFELNLNTGYHIVNQEVFRVYLLLGMHYASFRYDRPVRAADSEESGNDIGLNIGGGIELDYESIILFLEPKRSVEGFDQFSITVGGRIVF